MKKYEKLKEKTENFLYDHYGLKRTLYETKGVLTAILCAFIFAFGFCAFVTPYAKSASHTIESFTVITGGISGLSQNLSLFLKIAFNVELDKTTLEAIGYTAFNLPILIFGFLKVGKRFALITAINVIVSSVFIMMFPSWNFTNLIAQSELIQSFPIVRVLFGGICTGLSSALAFKGEISCGGIDVITYYISLRKSTSVGKYAVIGNGFIVTLYTLLLIIDQPNEWGFALISLFYSFIYIVTVMVVIDLINLRNKKVQVELITQNEKLPEVLLSHFPHSATICKGKGAFSGKERTIIYMVVSSSEMKKVISLARKVDDKVFCTVTSLVQVYGNFFIRPIQ